MQGRPKGLKRGTTVYMLGVVRKGVTYRLDGRGVQVLRAPPRPAGTPKPSISGCDSVIARLPRWYFA